MFIAAFVLDYSADMGPELQDPALDIVDDFLGETDPATDYQTLDGTGVGAVLDDIKQL